MQDFELFFVAWFKNGILNGMCVQGVIPKHLPYHMEMEFDTKQLHQLPFSEGHQVCRFKNRELGNKINKRHEPPKPRSTLHF